MLLFLNYVWYCIECVWRVFLFTTAIEEYAREAPKVLDPNAAGSPRRGGAGPLAGNT
jgi:hypothetical protein